MAGTSRSCQIWTLEPYDWICLKVVLLVKQWPSISQRICMCLGGGMYFFFRAKTCWRLAEAQHMKHMQLHPVCSVTFTSLRCRKGLAETPISGALPIFEIKKCHTVPTSLFSTSKFSIKDSITQCNPDVSRCWIWISFAATWGRQPSNTWHQQFIQDWLSCSSGWHDLTWALRDCSVWHGSCHQV